MNLALNVSAVQLADLRVVDDVREALAASGLRAGDLVLEVTETAEVVDLDCAAPHARPRSPTSVWRWRSTTSAPDTRA